MKKWFRGMRIRQVIIWVVFILASLAFLAHSYFSTAQKAVEKQISNIEAALNQKNEIAYSITECAICSEDAQSKIISMVSDSVKQYNNVITIDEKIKISDKVDRLLDDYFAIKHKKEALDVDEKSKKLMEKYQKQKLLVSNYRVQFEQDQQHYNQKISRFSIIAKIMGFEKSYQFSLSSLQGGGLMLILFFLAIVLIVTLLSGLSSRDGQIDLKIPIGYPPPNPTNRPFGSGGYVTGGCIEADSGSSLKNYNNNNVTCGK